MDAFGLFTSEIVSQMTIIGTGNSGNINGIIAPFVIVTSGVSNYNYWNGFVVLGLNDVATVLSHAMSTSSSASYDYQEWEIKYSRTGKLSATNNTQSGATVSLSAFYIA